MAQSGNYSPGDVNDVSLEVRVNGIVRLADKVSWGGDTSGGLPDQVVAAGTGMLSRTGTIAWAQSPVTTDAPHPLRQEDGWPPREGDSLEIDATVNGVTFRRFTGRLGRTTGSLTDATLSSAFTDTIDDSLSTVVNIEPRVTSDLGLSHRIAWEALEQSKLGMLPQPDEGPGETILHTILQGDIYPTIGAGSYEMENTSRSEDPYGFTKWDGLRSLPLADATPSGRSTLILARGATGGAASTVSVQMTNGDIYKLSHSATGALYLQANGETVRTESWSGEGVPILAFYIGFGSMGVWTSASTVRWVGTPTVNTGRVSLVSGDGLAAVQVRYIASPLEVGTEVVRLAPTYPFSMTRSYTATQKLPATRGFENVTARSVVDSWGDATLTSLWMDEFGHARSVARDRLLIRGRSQVVEVDQRVFAGSWALGEDSVFSSVVVKGERGAVQKASGNRYRTTIYREGVPRGFDETLPPTERFVEAEREVDWGPIDLTPEVAGLTTVGNALNNSWSGAVVTDAALGNDAYERWAHLYGVDYNISIERLGQRTLKITESVSGIPAGETVYLKIASEGTDIHRAVRGQPTPFLRAQWKSTWASYSKTAKGGPKYAPVLEHDAGWWLTPGDGQELANQLMAEVKQVVPTFSGVSTLWDPRRQVGDVEDWVARDHNGDEAWRAKVLIIGYDEEWSEGIPTQSVYCRAISVVDQRAGKTYFDLTNAYSTYASTAASGATYQQLYNALPGTF